MKLPSIEELKQYNGNSVSNGLEADLRIYLRIGIVHFSKDVQQPVLWIYVVLF